MSRCVVALGGNTLVEGDEQLTVETQRAHIGDTIAALGALRERFERFVFTHGNGPQVGARLLEQDAADGPEAPLDVLVAETQAQIGYLIATEYERAWTEPATALVTRVHVDPEDPEFDDPSKPVGPYYDEAEAEDRTFETTRVTKADGTRAYRRVVPSPIPIGVVESEAISCLADKGSTVVCGGGGGVPVVDSPGDLTGVPAVVDKDYTSRLVAEAVDASTLLMLTDVPCVYRGFGTQDQEPLRKLSVDRARELLDAGEFPAGSMGPKVEACADFVADTGGRAVICDDSNLSAALDGDAGTTIRT